MIAYLSGTLQAKAPHFLILKSGEVGYLVFVHDDIWYTVNAGEKLELYISTIVREQEISLYGFKTLDDRQFFELLLQVSGIGPKSALAFFEIPRKDIASAILAGDSEFLTSVKGVGKKTAERMIIELKNKQELIEISSVKGGNSGASTDVIIALENLGYSRTEIIKVLQNAPEGQNTEDTILWFLQQNS